MIDVHKERNADCTIAVIEVPMEEASRFGIMNADETGKIYEFEEKPKNPKSNLASMGIYVFSWNKLKKYLIEDEADPDSSNDFGKNIIPKMLDDRISSMVKKYSYSVKNELIVELIELGIIKYEENTTLSDKINDLINRMDQFLDNLKSK